MRVIVHANDHCSHNLIRHPAVKWIRCGSSEGMARAVTVNRAEAMSSLLAVPA